MSSPAAQLGAGVSELAFPGLGRLIFGFLITIAMAFGAALLLRRMWPLFRKRTAASSDVRPVGRTALSGTLTLHLVEIDGARLAVAEGRSGVAVTVLPPQRSSEPNV